MGRNFLATIVLLVNLGKLANGYQCVMEEWTSKEGILQSPGYPGLYSSDICKIWYFTAKPRAPSGQRIFVTISVQTMDLPRQPDGSCMDMLLLGSIVIPELEKSVPNHQLCANGSSTIEGYMAASDFWIRLTTHPDSPGGRFLLEWSWSDGMEACGEEEFQCRNLKCIPRRWRCNGLDECRDKLASDEKGCPTTTTPITTSSTPTSSLPSFRYKMPASHFMAGVLQLPTLSGHVHRPITFVWDISLAEAGIVQLRILRLSLKDARGSNYLRVYEGTSEERGVIIGEFFENPQIPLQSKDRTMLVELHTSGDLEAISFVATYQKKGFCINNQTKCGMDENDCYEPEQRCDGRENCLASGSDELGCTSALCSPEKGLFLCCNRRCVSSSQECDHSGGICVDENMATGELSPEGQTRIILAAVAGSLVCSLLLVLTLGCYCKVYALHNAQRCVSRRGDSPLSRIQAELLRRRAPPPPYHEAMRTSRSYDEVQREYLAIMQAQAGAAQTDSGSANNGSDPPADSAVVGAGEAGTVAAMSVNSTNTAGNWGLDRASSTAQLIPDEGSSDSENGASDGEDCSRLGEEESESVQMEMLESAVVEAEPKDGDEESGAPRREMPSDTLGLSAVGSKPSATSTNTSSTAATTAMPTGTTTATCTTTTGTTTARCTTTTGTTITIVSTTTTGTTTTAGNTAVVEVPRESDTSSLNGESNPGHEASCDSVSVDVDSDSSESSTPDSRRPYVLL